jgi:NAD(P)-dependent dehydrogenase (short-subunit alcohol dehydrogenase family)
MRLQDKVALITGAASGIGRESALLFAAEGARVVAVDINDEAGQETVGMIAARGGQAVYVHADVAKAAGCQKMIETAETEYGRLDILFNNAGIMHSADDDAVNTDEDVWDLTMAINLKGSFWAANMAFRRCAGPGAVRLSTPPLSWPCWARPRPNWPTPPAKGACWP